MGSAEVPLKVKLFMAVLYRPGFDPQRLFNTLKSEFGPFECLFGPIPFVFSDYYGDEMGSGLLKSYGVFEGLMDRGALPKIKVTTNGLEREYLEQGKRIVNLDPGYIARDKLVLATTKDFYHRLYLSDGIFGEVTLHFRKGVFRHFSWTYPDYKDEAFLAFLTKARAKFMRELRGETGVCATERAG